MTKETLTEKYHTASLTKKCTSQNNVTPIHLACLNPHIAVLKKLMDQNPDVNVMDGYLSKPIHFAACCENTHALELLLSLGANLNDLNSTK
jgi:ankyrin repeat protein